MSYEQKKNYSELQMESDIVLFDVFECPLMFIFLF